MKTDSFIRAITRRYRIVSDWMNVYPRDIEEVMVRHPAVREAAVFGVPDKKLGEAPIAEVVLRSADAVSPEEIRDWTNERVTAEYQRVSKVVVVEDFPRIPLGKPLKREMTAPYREGRRI